MSAVPKPKRAVRRVWTQVAALAGILLLFCGVCRLVFFRSFTASVRVYGAVAAAFRRGEVAVTAEDPGIVRLGEIGMRDDYLLIPVEIVAPGRTDVLVRWAGGDINMYVPLRTTQFSVYDLSNGNFNGDSVILIAVTLFWLTVSAIMVWHLAQCRGPAFYDYGTIYYTGFSIFALVTGLGMLYVTLTHLAHPWERSMLYAYDFLVHAGTTFMLLTSPLIAAFAAAMAVSNIALLRHEKPRFQNALGLAVSFLLIAGEALMFRFSMYFSGSDWEGRVHDTLLNTYATCFVYFECMLAGAVICGIRAARRRPAQDKDFIIILGCWFRPDGSLPPLIRGRVDAALDFWRRQKEATGRTAAFIPSGARGPNETMTEAAAMRGYLLAQGIPPELILPEEKAVNTFQNMLLSKEIIQKTRPDGKAAFATTNYHVFRSGLLARSAGLEAEGIGGPTKWWFWPNAFMRETAGLLLRCWKEEAVFLIVLVVFFGVLSMVVTV